MLLLRGDKDRRWAPTAGFSPNLLTSDTRRGEQSGVFHCHMSARRVFFELNMRAVLCLIAKVPGLAHPHASSSPPHLDLSKEHQTAD